MVFVDEDEGSLDAAVVSLSFTHSEAFCQRGYDEHMQG